MTYGGGPEGGIVRLRSSVTSAALWYVWHRDWGRPASVLRIPRELTPVSRHDDGYEAIKLVMDDYELGEDEYYLDDMEDSAEEEEDSEGGMRNDDDDEANEGRDDDSDTETTQAAAEIAELQEEIREQTEQLTREKPYGGGTR